jgi:glycosyltransferase involved in cell wall biosynthesis
LPEPLLDGRHYVAIKDDASDVVEVCQALLDDDARRQQIATSAMAYFDCNFSPQSLARRILQHAIAQLEGRR